MENLTSVAKPATNDFTLNFCAFQKVKPNAHLKIYFNKGLNRNCRVRQPKMGFHHTCKSLNHPWRIMALFTKQFNSNSQKMWLTLNFYFTGKHTKATSKGRHSSANVAPHVLEKFISTLSLNAKLYQQMVLDWNWTSSAKVAPHNLNKFTSTLNPNAKLVTNGSKLKFDF